MPVNANFLFPRNKAMITEGEFSLIRYNPRQKKAVLAFIYEQARTHYHLDWHPIAQWLQDSDTVALLAYNQQQKIMGILMLTSPTEGVAWLRLLSLHNQAPSSVLAALIAQARVIAPEYQIEQIASIQSEHWLQAFLLANGFTLIDHIIHMKYNPPASVTLPPMPVMEHCVIHEDELSLIAAIDSASFAPHWRMTLADLQEVWHKDKCYITVARVDGQSVGYQLSTDHQDWLHLTRLAVLPNYRNRNIGMGLVQGIMQHFPYHTITVNTQASNHASQRVYTQLGFRYQDWVTPVWNMVL